MKLISQINLKKVTQLLYLWKQYTQKQNTLESIKYTFDALFEYTHDIIILTNLEELSFFTVLAFPKASRMGLAWSNCLSSSP